jgi:hypothetical protein
MQGRMKDENSDAFSPCKDLGFMVSFWLSYYGKSSQRGWEELVFLETREQMLLTKHFCSRAEYHYWGTDEETKPPEVDICPVPHCSKLLRLGLEHKLLGPHLTLHCGITLGSATKIFK